MTTYRPEDQLKRMLEQTLIPPTTVTELDPDSVDAATSRLADPAGSLSESYQLNSQHTSASLKRLPDAGSARSIRTFYFETMLKAYEKRRGLADGSTLEAAALPQQMREALTPLWTEPAVVDSLYCMDVLVLADDAIWRAIPGAPGFMRERDFGTEQMAQLRRSLALRTHEGQAVVLLVGHLARAGYLYGDRSSRVVNQMAGVVSGALHRAGNQHGLKVEVVEGFIDAYLNRAAGCDGVERSAAIALFLSERAEAPAPGQADAADRLSAPAAGTQPPSIPAEAESLNLQAQDFAQRWRKLPAGARASLLETMEAAEDLDEVPRDVTLGRLAHRVFERSVQEFFSTERQSTQLPEELIAHCRPRPDGIALPDVEPEAESTLRDVLAARRSTRSYERGSLTAEQLARVLRTSAGVNDWEDGYGVRGMPKFPFPSIGGLDSNELGVLIFNIEGIEPGYYVYDKVGHSLVPRLRGDLRLSLVSATFESEWLFYAPAVFVLANDQSKVSWKYRTRGYRISHLDQGALMQNLALAATANGLGTCPVAGYFDEVLARTLGYANTDTFIAALVALGQPTRLGHGG